MVGPVYCRSCKAPINASDDFCPKCGAGQRISPVAQPQQPPAPQYPQHGVPVSHVQVPQADRDRYQLEEMARQYKSLTYWGLVGLLFIPAYLLGVLIIIYVWIQKPTFRRKVAELGYDPEAWEAPLRKHATTCNLVVLGVILLGVIVFALSTYGTQAGTAPSSPQ